MMVAFSKRPGQGLRRDWVKDGRLHNPLITEVCKSKAFKLVLEKARAKGKPIGHPMVVDSVDAELVAAQG